MPGLYVIGEAVDVTGWLGGYNFQWAWSIGLGGGRGGLNTAVAACRFRDPSVPAKDGSIGSALRSVPQIALAQLGSWARSGGLA